MRKIMWRLSVLFLVAVAFSASAQQAKRILTFEEALKMALKNAVLLNQQRNSLEINQAQRTSALANMGPNVSLNASASQFNGNSFNQNTGQVVNGIRDNVSGSLNASINLFNGFNQINTVKQASQNLDAQANLINRTTQDVINTVSNQYLQVMLDVELLTIGKENFDALTKQLEQIKEFVAVGSRSVVDEYNQDALTKGAELLYIQAEIALDNDKALLAQTLLMDPFEEFDVERPSWDVNAIGSEELNPIELSAKAKQYRGDYISAVKTESAQRYAMRAARGAMTPSLSAFFNYGSAYNFQRGEPDSTLKSELTTSVIVDGTQPSGYALQTTVAQQLVATSPQRSFNDQFRMDNVYKQYGFQLSIPLFNGFQNRVSYTRQKVQYLNSQLDRRNVEYQISNDVVRASRNYNGAKKAFVVTVDQLKSAEIAFSLETERYNLGVTTFVDFINSNRVLVQSQTDKAQAEYRLLFQKMMLDYAVGTLKIEDIP